MLPKILVAASAIVLALSVPAKVTVVDNDPDCTRSVRLAANDAAADDCWCVDETLSTCGRNENQKLVCAARKAQVAPLNLPDDSAWRVDP